MTFKKRRVICGWCPTELTESNHDVAVHFLTVHGLAGTQSVRYYDWYDTPEDELEAIINGTYSRRH